MKKYMIRCDIEGVSGVVSYEQAEPGKSEYSFGRRMFMADLKACLEGLHAGGAAEIVLYDMHYYGRNIDLADLPADVTAICGKPPYRADWAGGLDETCAGMVLLGLHSKAHTPCGLLAHSYELEIADLRLCGVSVGEIGMEAAIAGDLGVPTIMITGDSSGVAEAQALIPGIIAVAVKESRGASSGICSSLAASTGRIHQAAMQVARHAPAVQPYRTGPKVTLEVRLHQGPFLQTIKQVYPGPWSSDDTLVISAATATAAWANYLDLKFQAQKK